jgi:tetratricopeptide (TPR) repeat protein
MAIGLLGLGGWWMLGRRGGPPPPVLAPLAIADDRTVFAAYAGSASCKTCHETAYNRWVGSNHALAQRLFDPAVDRVAFDPPRTVRHGTQVTEIGLLEGRPVVTAPGPASRPTALVATEVLGHRPLRQFLLPTEGGRLQMTEVAWDPAKAQWFNVFGDEDRQPGEWGHWTGRGMNWNSMCAECHNTRLRKNYDSATDTYNTTMAERGVGCEACHGPMKNHVDWQAAHAPSRQKDPTVGKLPAEQWLAVCGNCHARRRNLTGEFMPGDSFLDHFSLSIPDLTDTYYPDGQVRDENFEFTSFLSSKMHSAGVRCVNCHDPHAARPTLQGNALCMACHVGGYPKAPAINPTAHSFHKADNAGNLCVECHMPVTVYMQRHPRRDHGFTIPDPLLTQQLGIPNACNRCHADKDTAWSLAAVEQWYGPRMDRPSRQRALALGRGRQGDPGAVADLLAVLKTDPQPFWRASAAAMLARGEYITRPEVSAALIAACAHPEALVRENAVRALGPLAQVPGPARAAAQKLLTDPVRAVRAAAAWALRAEVDPASVAAADLLLNLRHNADQPAGAMNLGLWHLARNDPRPALEWFTKAADWDAHSAAPQDALAVTYATLGQPQLALEAMLKAVEREPRDGEYWYKLALAAHEAGQSDRALQALQKAVELTPRHGAAWYNLGLLYAGQGQPERALEALTRAEQLDATDPRIPYAAATVLARMGRTAAARQALDRVLRLNRNYGPALQLLQELER